jgi:hypothetical protein
MVKNLRIWVAGECLLDEPANEDEIEVDTLTGPHAETVKLADKRGQHWRVEFGDRDADVDDTCWRS